MKVSAKNNTNVESTFVSVAKSLHSTKPKTENEANKNKGGEKIKSLKGKKPEPEESVPQKKGCCK